MALRDPRNKSRNNASRRTTSATRSKRSTTSAKYNPRPTSSSTRAKTKGTSTKVTTGKGTQISQARRVQQANPGRTARAARTAARPGARVRGAVTNPYAVAAQIIASDIANRSVADGTLKGKPVRSKPGSNAGKYNTRDADGTVRSRAKVGPAKVGPKKVGTVAQSFDRSYAAAKKAGKKTFMFRGKKYTTN